jgi:hypothetical protein
MPDQKKRSYAKRAATGLVAAGLIFGLAACKGEDTQSTNDTGADQTTQNQGNTNNAYQTRKSEPYHDVFMLTLEDIGVTTSEGQTFNASAVAYCDEIEDDYNPKKAEDVQAYTAECRKIIENRLNYRACAYHSFLTAVSVDNPELRARALGRDVKEITDSLLLTRDEIESMVRDREYNIYTVTGVSDIDAAMSKRDRPLRDDCGLILRR